MEPAERETTILLMRHAEKLKGEDPNLSSEGLKRARFLSKYLNKYNITGVYSSRYKRTKQTAEPIAKKLGLKVNSSIGPTDYKKLLKDILNKHKGKSVLVVGHSNTIPGFVSFLKPGGKTQKIKGGDFSSLFTLQILKDKVSLKRESYEPF